MKESDIRPMSTFRENGMLWYINKVAFHPRGFALGVEVDRDDGTIKGWTILGNGKEVWSFKENDDDDGFQLFEALLDQFRNN